MMMAQDVQAVNTAMAAGRIWLTGASYGIGRAVAIELARQGAFIGLTARSEDQLEQVLEDVEAAGGKGMVLTGDVTNGDSMKKCAEAMREQVGGADPAWHPLSPRQPRTRLSRATQRAQEGRVGRGS